MRRSLYDRVAVRRPHHCFFDSDVTSSVRTVWPLAIVAALCLSEVSLAQATLPTEDRAPHRARHIEVSGATLEYLDFGGPRDGSVVLLLPGYGDNAHVYDDLAPRLTDRYRVFALSPRGHGASSTPSSGYSIDAFAEDVRRLLDTLHVSKAVLVGHSIAGRVITRLAVQYPNRVQALVYLDAADAPGDLASRDSILAANPIRRPQPTDSTAAGARRWYAEMFYGFWTTALANSFLSHGTDSTARNRPRLLPALLADAAKHPSQYARTRAPILAINSVKTVDANYPWLRSPKDTEARMRAQRYLDEVLNPWFGRGVAQLQRERPDAHIVTLRGHHYIFLVEEQKVAEELRRFLGGAAR